VDIWTDSDQHVGHHVPNLNLPIKTLAYIVLGHSECRLNVSQITIQVCLVMSLIFIDWNIILDY